MLSVPAAPYTLNSSAYSHFLRAFLQPFWSSRPPDGASHALWLSDSEEDWAYLLPRSTFYYFFELISNYKIQIAAWGFGFVEWVFRLQETCGTLKSIWQIGRR